MTKPPYELPSMASLRAIQPRFSLVSTFSGCGGSCLGFRMEGFRTLWASEFIPSARDTYRVNFPDVPVDDRDIREVTADEILERIGLAVGELDVLEGSPPCAAFSISGAREGSWGKIKPYSETKQRVDDLFFEFARILDGLQPRVFVTENVPALATGKALGFFREIISALESCGYRVDARVLDAQWLGVPQRRKRLIFVGTRKDLDIAPRYPDPLPYRYSIRDAFALLDENDPTHQEERGMLMERLWGDGKVRKSMGELLSLKEGESSKRYLNMIRSAILAPAPTIVQAGKSPGTSAAMHPIEPRGWTTPELKLLFTFPQDFALTGTYKQRYERVARAVPPFMMRAVARCVAEILTEAAKAA